MKKIIIIFISLLILSILGYGLFYYYKSSNEIKEEYTDIVIVDSIEIEVFSKQKISNYVSIENGEIINDDYINTDEIGLKEIEVLYFNSKHQKRKSHFKVNILDTVSPIILGGSNYTYKVRSKDELIYSFISADNYTKIPKREIIGEYDMNKIGKYNLTFKITDESNNFSTKDFTLNIVDKVISKQSQATKTLYDDVVATHKNDSNKIGLDVSKWQGTINFDKLKEKGVEFIMIRVGYQAGFNKNSVLDTFFERNIKEANRVGIPVGIYFYTYATSKKEAYDQAIWIVDKIKDYEVSLPITFDFEEWNKFSRQNLSIKDINDIATHFMETVESKGYKGMNYSSKYFLESIWNIDKYPVWLAHYTKATDYKGKYAMWQLCNDGRIDGINGAVDINIMYEKL